MENVIYLENHKTYSDFYKFYICGLVKLLQSLVCHNKRFLSPLLLYPSEASGGYFGLAFAMPQLPCIKRFSPVRFTKFIEYLHWGVSFCAVEISLILKNKMAAAGISLKIIYLFLLAGSHK